MDDINPFFFRCADQPWLGNNESRNIGNVYEYGLKKGEIKFTARDANLPYIKTMKVDFAKYSGVKITTAWTPSLF